MFYYDSFNAAVGITLLMRIWSYLLCLLVLFNCKKNNLHKVESIFLDLQGFPRTASEKLQAPFDCTH